MAVGDGYVTNNFDVLSLCFVGDTPAQHRVVISGMMMRMWTTTTTTMIMMMMMRANNRVKEIPRKNQRESTQLLLICNSEFKFIFSINWNRIVWAKRFFSANHSEVIPLLHKTHIRYPSAGRKIISTTSGTLKPHSTEFTTLITITWLPFEL